MWRDGDVVVWRGNLLRVTGVDYGENRILAAPYGGGLVRSYLMSELRTATPRELRPMWVAGEFQVEDGEAYFGYRQPGIRWNGWERVLFDRVVSTRLLLSAVNGEIARFEYESWTDTFKIWYVDEPDVECVVGQRIEVDGRSVVVYDVTSGWCWQYAAAPVSDADDN